MTEVIRIDRGKVGRVQRTDQGYLRVDGWATRTGILIYRNPDGTERRELRRPEEVSKADSLSTLAQVPVTDEHPPAMLTADNTRQYQRGYTGETVKMDGDRVALTVTITDSDLIRKAEAGQKELSTGYRCDLVMEPGVWKGQRYDAEQTNIRYNHLAVVPIGRAGPEVRLRLDAAESDIEHVTKEEPPVAKINIDGVEYEVTEPVAVAIQQKMRNDAAATEREKGRADAAEATAAQAKKDADAMKAKLDTAEADLAKRTDAADQVPAMVKARLDLERTAAPLLPKDQAEKLDGMSDDDIRLAVIKVHAPAFERADNHSADYIAARFDAAVESLKDRVDHTGDLRKKADPAKQQGDRVDADEARQKFIEDQRNAWKQPLMKKEGN